MYIKRHITPVMIYFFTWRLAIFSLLSGVVAFALYRFLEWKWVAIPWLPVSLIGTAVAFYVGFKNNQAYDRYWEARIVWGSITNLSRSFASACRSFIQSDQQGSKDLDAKTEIRTIIYRHLAWLYCLKHSMWQRTKWEHQYRVNARYRRFFEKGFSYAGFDEEVGAYISKEELRWLHTKQNKCTQLLDKQSQHLLLLRKNNLIEDFRLFELQKFITDLFAEQGKTERIKNTPLPRQFATSSTIFIIIFILLLPYGMITEFNKLGEGMLWLMIPFNFVVSWVFSLMEYIGDYSENPFEGLVNDVPVLTIVRNIEIDLKDMLDEKDLPEKIQPVFDVLL